jgi:hypothetical protein
MKKLSDILIESEVSLAWAYVFDEPFKITYLTVKIFFIKLILKLI